MQKKWSAFQTMDEKNNLHDYGRGNYKILESKISSNNFEKLLQSYKGMVQNA